MNYALLNLYRPGAPRKLRSLSKTVHPCKDLKLFHTSLKRSSFRVLAGLLS